MRLVLAIAACLSIAFAQSAAAQTWRADQIDDLKRAAEAAPLEGLPVPKDGLWPLLSAEHLSAVDPNFASMLDLAAETLFIELARMYAQGEVDPSSVDQNWRIPRPPEPDFAVLLARVRSGERLSTVLAALLPDTRDYRALRVELARLRGEPASAESAAHLEQVLANLERWRWLPRAFPERRVEVRLAQYQLYYFDGVGAQPTLFDVIVGAPRTPSPVFAATIESVTLNPDWDPPASIVTRELVPRFRRNPARAAQEGFEVLDANGVAVDASAINWRARPFPYHLRQRPGPQNALGRLRFDLPNPFSVYLHDTPTQSLFLRDVRALSHGCIRVKTPTALAASLLGAPWNEAALGNAIDQGASQTIPLPAPAPVFLLYLTAIADENGAINYLSDINHRDGPLAARLGGPDVRAVAFGPTHAETCAPG